MYLKALMLMVPELLSQASNHAQRHKSKWESDIVRTDIFKLHSLIVDDQRADDFRVINQSVPWRHLQSTDLVSEAWMPGYPS